MQQPISTIPGYRSSRYLLVMEPHEELRNKIAQVRKDFSDQFRSTPVIGRPNLLLAQFVQLELMEERITNRLNTVAMGQYPFRIDLKDYGSYPAHTLFINVATREPIRNLMKEIKPFQKLFRLNQDNKPWFTDDPHITLARRLTPWQYEQGWLAYSKRHFTGRFLADNMTLLRQREGEHNYVVVRRFAFQNLPVSTVQGQLFS